MRQYLEKQLGPPTHTNMGCETVACLTSAENFLAEVEFQFFWHFPNSVVSLVFRLDRSTNRDFRWMAITRWSKDRPCADFVG